MSSPTDSGSRQAHHYDEILSDYDRHYGDRFSQLYRKRFFLEPMLAGGALDGLEVADVAAGSGHTTLGLLEMFPNCRLTGFDVSPIAVETYKARTRRPAYVWDLATPPNRSWQFDAAIVVGGLHHCANHLPRVIEHLAQIVKAGGHLYLTEPNRETFLEPLRRLWYRSDRYFDASTEEALVLSELESMAAPWFAPVRAQYLGGPAYYLVYNSLVFRIPLGVKAWIAPPLLWCEGWMNAIPASALRPYFAASLQRRSR